MTLRPADDSPKHLCFASVPFDTQTLISQTAERCPVKSTLEAWS